MTKPSKEALAAIIEAAEDRKLFDKWLTAADLLPVARRHIVSGVHIAAGIAAIFDATAATCPRKTADRITWVQLDPFWVGRKWDNAVWRYCFTRDLDATKSETFAPPRPPLPEMEAPSADRPTPGQAWRARVSAREEREAEAEERAVYPPPTILLVEEAEVEVAAPPQAAPALEVGAAPAVPGEPVFGDMVEVGGERVPAARVWAWANELKSRLAGPWQEVGYVSPAGTLYSRPTLGDHPVVTITVENKKITVEGEGVSLRADAALVSLDAAKALIDNYMRLRGWLLV